jgi:hypothetical protein
MAREGTPSETGLYLAIEKHLKASKEPLTCVELFEFNDVRSAAETVNKVSDALGHLWRRKFIERRVTPKSPHHQAKYEYYWRETVSVTPPPVQRRVPAPTPAASGAPTIMKRGNVEIHEDGNNIVIDLPKLYVTIKVK